MPYDYTYQSPQFGQPITPELPQLNMGMQGASQYQGLTEEERMAKQKRLMEMYKKFFGNKNKLKIVGLGGK